MVDDTVPDDAFRFGDHQLPALPDQKHRRGAHNVPHYDFEPLWAGSTSFEHDQKLINCEIADPDGLGESTSRHRPKGFYNGTSWVMIQRDTSLRISSSG